MKKSMKIVTVLAGLCGIAAGIAGLIMKLSEQKTVSVIGGADGPTAIFVAGKSGVLWLWLLIGGAAVFTAAAVYFGMKSRK